MTEKKKKILIVEDEWLEAKGFSAILEKYFGQKIEEITIKTNGKSGVLAAKQLCPDLIFLDIELPILNGLEAAEQIRLFDQQVPIVMVTAYPDFHFAQTALRHHVADYIIKPYSIATIQKLMTKILNMDESPSLWLAYEEKLVHAIKEQNLSLFSSILEEWVREEMRKTDDHQDIASAIRAMLIDSMYPQIEPLILARHRLSLRQMMESFFNQSAGVEESKIGATLIASQMINSVKEKDEQESEMVRIVKHYIQTHYRDDLKLDRLAQFAAVSKFHLSRVFKEETGENLSDFILKVRIAKAKDMLCNGYSVFETSYATGFHDPSWFNKRFKLMEGMTPTEFITHCQQRKEKNSSD